MKYFTYIEDMLPEYAAIIEHNQNMVDLTIFRVCIYDIPQGKDIRWKSDVARIMWLRDNPDWIWLDADTKVLKPIDFKLEKGFPYFVNVKGQIDITAIAGNGCSKVFDDALKHINPDVGWAQCYMDTQRTRIKTFPAGYFYHYGLSKLRK